MKKIDTILSNIAKGLTTVSVIMLLIMLVITFSQVVMRYVFNSPFVWAEELTLVLLLWFAFITISVSVKDDSHIALEAFYLKFGPKTQKFLDAFRHLFLMFFAVLMILYGWELIIVAKTQHLPATKILRSFLYMSEFVAAFFIFIFSLNNLMKVFAKSEVKHD